MGLGGFSWKRAVGLSAAKARLSSRIGIPFTKSGRQRKIGSSPPAALPRCAAVHGGHSRSFRWR
jgi:hypothetical protein